MTLETIQELEQERNSLDLSVRIWPEQHNIPLHKYAYWVKKTKQPILALEPHSDNNF